MYYACPRKFYLRYILKLKTRPSIHLIRGQIVHQTLHGFHKNHAAPSPETPIRTTRESLLSTFNRLWENAGLRLNSLPLGEGEIERFRQESERMLLNYSHVLLKQNGVLPDRSEMRLYSKKHRLMGIIDAVFENRQNPILVDYKTSKKAIITDEITRQAALYALLYEDQFLKTPEALWVHFLIEPADPIPIHIDEHLVDYAHILVESVRAKTLSEDKRDYPCKCGGYCETDMTGQNGTD